MEQIQKPRTTAKDFFIYLGVIVALYVVTIFWVQLLFAVINEAVSDAVNPYYGFANSGISSGIATLVIAFPVYLFLARLVNRDLRVHPEKSELWVRKWLTYLTLFLAGIAIAVSLITTIKNFLDGELTLRFILKVLTVLVAAGSVFGYYLCDLKRDVTVKRGSDMIYAWTAGILIIAAIILGFVVFGSPGSQRAKRLDLDRVFALQSIWEQVKFQYQQTGRVPQTIEALESDVTGFRVPADPETGVPYIYRVVSPLSIELCATFTREGDDPFGYTGGPSKPVPPGASEEVVGWAHEAGEQCFTLDIDPELLPQVKR